jgi:hypothetical protein
MKRYKATLFKQEYIDQRAEPIDTILLDKKCYPTAEKFFYDKRGWKRGEHYHIEIENMPRFLA